MTEKRAIDGFGATALIGFSALLAFNQVVIKLTTAGIAPAAQAGFRSVGAVIVLLIWAYARGIRFTVPRAALGWGILSGFLFAFEFLCLFLALDLTTVSRASIIFYTMPVWLALAAHFLLPGERLTGIRILGLALAVLGVVIAMGDRSNGQASLAGDILALLGTLGWAAVALMVRATPLSQTAPVTQLMFQVVISAPIMLAFAALSGPMIRDFEPVYLLSLAFQSICIASLGFLSWFWLLTIYRASSVASFAFLAPVLSVILGWLVLGEHIGPLIWVALVMVATGIFLINRR
ncbi:DMT family transporter [Seohaeicola nanhaiensis]|uniref:DMT family transporter n=1 Tax=Seohaeicola nanhaiensis TaxID=1387282 RepID=A0ABV9KEV4_9RHOB